MPLLDVLLRIHWQLWRILLQSSNPQFQSSKPYGITGRNRYEMLSGSAEGREERTLQ